MILERYVIILKKNGEKKELSKDEFLKLYKPPN